MDVIYQFRRLMFAQVLSGIVAFCLAASNPAMLLLAGSAGALAWYWTEGPSGRAFPRWLINTAALAVAGWALLSVRTGGVNLVLLAGYFIIWLQVVLLYADKTNREYFQLLLLSVLLVTAASTLSMSLLFAMAMALYCLVALLSILFFQFKMTSDRVLAAHQRGAPAHVPVERVQPMVGRGHRWQLRAQGVFLALGCGLVGMLVFLMIPRTGEPGHLAAWGEPSRPASAGFTERVRLSSAPLASPTDQQPVLNLRIIGEAGGGATRSHLVRGAALDYYSPHTRSWSRSDSLNALNHTMDLSGESENLLARLPADASSVVAEFEIRRRQGTTVFTLAQPTVAIVGGELNQVQINPVDYQIRARVMPNSVRYRLRAAGEPLPGAHRLYDEVLSEQADPGATAVELTAWRHQPPDPHIYARVWDVENGRLREHVQALLARQQVHRDPNAWHTGQDIVAAQILAQHLRQRGRYALSNPVVAEGSDPVIEFIFTHREGHCELFASALAAKVRSIGIPARLVTGYRASEFNAVGGYYVVRQRHAHAWTEVYGGPTVGWVAIDPTPSQQLEALQATPQDWLSGLRDLYEHAEYAWLSSFLAFDQAQQHMLFAGVEQTVSQAVRDEERILGRALAFLRGLADLQRLDAIGYAALAMTFVALIVAIGSFINLLLVRRRRLAALQLTTLPRSVRRGLARRLGFYLTMLDMLERHGHVRPAWQSPFSFAKELAGRQPLRFDAVVALTELFYEIRFGYRELDENRRSRIRAHLRQLEQSLARPERQAAGRAV